MPMFPLPAPILPPGFASNVVITPADARAVPAVLPTEFSRQQAGIDLASQLNSGAVMAPNWVYPCGRNGQCVTNLYQTSNYALDASCAAAAPECVDSVTRGLLSRLRPVLPEETRAYTFPW